MVQPIPGLPDLIGSGYAVTVTQVLYFLAALLVVLGIGRYVLRPLFVRALDRRHLDAHAKRPLQKVFSIGLFFVAVGIAFAVAGFGNLLTSLATIGAAATLAIGLATQDLLKNLVAGVFIFTDEPFRIGDWIEFDGHEGVVEDISLRVTRVRTFDNELLTVPNSQLTDGVIKNPVAADTLRQKFTFGIGYGDDVEEASAIIVAAAEDHPDILEDPAPSVRLVELGDSAVGLQSRFWIGDPSRADFVRIRGEYVADVKARFDEAGIDIPYPTRTLEGHVGLGDGEQVVAPEQTD